MASDGWAETMINVGYACEDVEAEQRAGLRKLGAAYNSVSDDALLFGYHDWSPELDHSLLVFDDNGMLAGSKPCPYELPDEGAQDLRRLLDEATASGGTAGELRMLARFGTLLETVAETPLMPGQHGCAIVSPERWVDWRQAKRDPWLDASR